MGRLMPVLAVLLILGVQVRSSGGKHQGTAALMEADRAFDAATAQRGVAGFASFLAPDVQTLRPDRPVVIGKDALVELWRPLLENTARSIRWAPLTAAIAKGRDFGYTLGRYQITEREEQRPQHEPRREGPHERIVSTGKYVTIWSRQSGGSWKVVFDSGVTDTAPQPAAKP